MQACYLNLDDGELRSTVIEAYFPDYQQYVKYLVEGHDKDPVIVLMADWQGNIFPCLADVDSNSSIDESQPESSNHTNNLPSVQPVDLMLEELAHQQLIINAERHTQAHSHLSTLTPSTLDKGTSGDNMDNSKLDAPTVVQTVNENTTGSAAKLIPEVDNNSTSLTQSALLPYSVQPASAVQASTSSHFLLGAVQSAIQSSALESGSCTPQLSTGVSASSSTNVAPPPVQRCTLSRLNVGSAPESAGKATQAAKGKAWQGNKK